MNGSPTPTAGRRKFSSCPPLQIADGMKDGALTQSDLHTPVLRGYAAERGITCQYGV